MESLSDKKEITVEVKLEEASCEEEDSAACTQLMPFYTASHFALFEKQNNNDPLTSIESNLSLSNTIKPELYTEERNLQVQLTTKTDDSQTRTNLFPCHQCGKAFGDNRTLQRHFLVHTGLRSYHCHECNKSFKLKGDLTRHSRIHSGEKPFSCTICGRCFAIKRNLMDHFRTHTPDKQYTCTLCSKSYAQKDSLHRHIRAHFGDKPFACEHCEKRFTLKKDLSQHILIHYAGIKPHKCEFCGQKFSLKGNLNRHMRLHNESKADYTVAILPDDQQSIQDLSYSDLQKESPNDLSFKLSLEVKETPENLSVVPIENGSSVNNFHLSENLSDKLQSSELAFCSACCRTFPSPESLQKHVQLVHEQSTRLPNNRYLCHVCEREFSLKGDLTRHLNSHNGIRPYNCDQCNKTFTLKSNLRQHLTTHTTNKTVTCPLCCKMFGNRRNLTLHLRRHEQATANFACTKCGHSFLAKSEHFFHHCSEDTRPESEQVPLNCSSNGESK